MSVLGRFTVVFLMFALSPGSFAAADTMTTIAGAGTAGFSGDGGPAILADLNRPAGIFWAPDSTLYISDTDNHRVRKVRPGGVITTVAGTGAADFSGDGGAATEASFDTPHGLFADGNGNLWIADTRNHRVRKMGPDGVIVTVAGTGVPEFSGDGGPATEAGLNRPHGLFMDGEGNFYIADTDNHRVRKMGLDGVIVTVAGTGAAGFSGDGGAATDARLNGPVDVVADTTGALYVSDRSNQRVRRIGPDGMIATAAGTGAAGFSGDGGAATEAELNGPRSISLDGEGNLYVVDMNNQRIRKVAADGTISTVAGNGTRGFSGDGRPAAEASLNMPRDVFAAPGGYVYIADRSNHRVRQITPGETQPPVDPEPPTPDFNRDGSVNFQDFVRFVQHYNTRQGEENFDARFDLNLDGEVGFSDFVRFAMAYGR